MTPIRVRYLLLLIGVLVWGLLDVPRRARTDPSNPGQHRTDVTVYTAASKALLDGHDPYDVTNLRGWHYLYPPLLATLLTPIAHLDSSTQALLFFLVSFACMVGSFFECRRLGMIVLGRPFGRWQALAAAGVVALPILNSLQRCQVGLLLLYPLLLGARLLLTAKGPRGWFLAGVTLALPAVLKVTPVLPVAILVAATFLRRASRPRAIPLAAGCTAGAVLFLLVVPAMVSGWRANVTNLGVWSHHIVGGALWDEHKGSHYHSSRNQSLGNAVYLAGNLVVDQHPGTTRKPMNTPGVATAVLVARALLLALLAFALVRMTRIGDALSVVTLFGLASVLAQLIAPISWAHSYTVALPAFIFVPASLYHDDRPRAASWAMAAATTLIIAHYASTKHVGQTGLLGIGMTAWFVWACLACASRRHPAAASAAEACPPAGT